MNVQHLVSDWHFMRFVRLALGTYIGIQAYQTQSILSALLAGFIPIQQILDAVEPIIVQYQEEKK
jgi:hypothetical protein